MRILTSILLLLNIICVAQKNDIKNIAATVSVERLQRNLYYLAGEKLEGRAMGSRGDTLASEFVAECFKENRVTAPYQNGNSYFQAITVFRKNFVQPAFFIGNKSYENWNGWTFTARSTETTVMNNLPVVFAGYGIETGNYNDFANVDVRNKAVLLLSGQPVDSTGKFLLSGTDQPAQVSSYQNILKARGALLILLYNKKFTEDSLQQTRSASQAVYKNQNAVAGSNLPVLLLSEDRVNELIAPSHKTIKELEKNSNKNLMSRSFDVNNKVSVQIKLEIKEETAPNVIGYVKGSDSSAGCVILSAHHDHVGRNDKQIYYGAVDNASGTTALMEIAALMNKAALEGLKPKRSIVFASYTGEERGLLGSFYFAAHPLFPLEKTWAVLNIDMMGRVDTFYSGRRADSNYAYFLIKDSLNRGIRTALYKANEDLGKLHLDAYYEQPQFMQRRLTGSDQYPFYLKNIPFVRIDCGFCKDYHQPTDTPDKINYELLSQQIQLAFLTTWNIANN